MDVHQDQLGAFETKDKFVHSSRNDLLVHDVVHELVDECLGDGEEDPSCQSA